MPYANASLRDRMILDQQFSICRVGGFRQSVIYDVEPTIRDWIKAKPDMALQEMSERPEVQAPIRGLDFR